MLTLPEEFLSVIVACSPLFTQPVWAHVQVRLNRIIRTVALSGPLVFGLDDTIERRRGDKIAAKGICRDSVRSSHRQVVKASGLRWLCLMILVPIPWAERVWAWPFLTVLCPSERSHQGRGRKHLKLTDRARQMLRWLARWLSERELVVADRESLTHQPFWVPNLTPHRIRFSAGSSNAGNWK
jgi:hypothetical protein